MTDEQQQRLLDALCHCLVMGRNLFDTPEEWAIAIRIRLLREGFRIVPCEPQP
jgi:predicted CoA-binding protein